MVDQSDEGMVPRRKSNRRQLATESPFKSHDATEEADKQAITEASDRTTKFGAEYYRARRQRDPEKYRKQHDKDYASAKSREERQRAEVKASGDPEQIKAYEDNMKAKQKHKNELQQRRRHDRNPNGRHYRPRGSGRKPRPGRNRTASTISTGSETGSIAAFDAADCDYVPHEASHVTNPLSPYPFHHPPPASSQPPLLPQTNLDSFYHPKYHVTGSDGLFAHLQPPFPHPAQVPSLPHLQPLQLYPTPWDHSHPHEQHQDQGLPTNNVFEAFPELEPNKPRHYSLGRVKLSPRQSAIYRQSHAATRALF